MKKIIIGGLATLATVVVTAMLRADVLGWFDRQPCGDWLCNAVVRKY